MLEETDRIDMIAKGHEGQPVLVITDAGITTDPEERKACLIAKLHAYASALGSPEFQQQFPEYKQSTIRVACANPPDEGIRGMSRITVRPQAQEPFDIPLEFEVIPPQWSKPE